mmetsp:Transcript_62773/g.147208  ORF Transcript_62773/g.147208 Transcript_62773/m.147208 type:complete len:576 (+) Transcript_62773:59-1786(+)
MQAAPMESTRSLASSVDQHFAFCRGVVAAAGDKVEKAAEKGWPEVPPAWQAERSKRDGPQCHITFLSKADLQSLIQSDSIWIRAGLEVPANDASSVAASATALFLTMPRCWEWIDLGTGACKDDRAETIFRVVLWPAAAATRAILGLPKKDFHITLGFHSGDVHSKPKGFASLLGVIEAGSCQQLVQEACSLVKVPGEALIAYADSIEQLARAALASASCEEASEVAALRALCLFYGRTKQPEQVLVSTDRLLQLCPHDETACRSKAYALVMLSRHEEALPALEAAESQLHKLPTSEYEVEHSRLFQALTFCRKKLGLAVPGSSECPSSGIQQDGDGEPAVKSKGNYPKTPHLPWSPGINSDDSRISCCRGLLACEVVVTEKLDGGNCCIKVESGPDGAKCQVYGRTHSQPATHESFSAAKEIATGLDWQELGDVELFGENMQAVHSIQYGNLASYFYVFAARRRGNWLSWDETTALAVSLGLRTVPVRFRGVIASEEELQARLETWKSEMSAVGADVKPEGFVVRQTAAISSTQFSECIAKYVRANHIQTDDSWKRTWRKARLGQDLSGESPAG